MSHLFGVFGSTESWAQDYRLVNVFATSSGVDRVDFRTNWSTNRRFTGAHAKP